MRRNDIVYSKHDEAGSMILFGRINRILTDGRIETIDCGRYIRVQEASDLVVVKDYKGFWDKTCFRYDYDTDTEIFKLRFRRMPTLRRLKQITSRYTNTVWKRNRKGLYCEHTRCMEPFKEE